MSGLAIAELVGALLHVRLSPVLAVGQAVIEVTPGSLAEKAVSTVGQNDKPFLVTGVVVGLVLLSALGGLIALRNRVLGLAVFVLLAAVAVASELTRPGAQATDALPALAGGVLGLITVVWLLGVTSTPTSVQSLPTGSREPGAGGLGRRLFLRQTAVVVVVAAGVAGVGRWIAEGRAAVEDARSKLRLGLRKPQRPKGVELGDPGLTPWVTPNSRFYRIDTALAVPLIKPQDWRLHIHGAVHKELTLTYPELISRGLVDAWITLCCVSNVVGGNLISNARWTGVPIRKILDEVGVQPGANALLSTSSDGFTVGTPLSALTDGRNALLAVAMNGVPLPIEHGFPVRQVVPGLYGYVSGTKWVTDWEVTSFDKFSAYWTQRGWSAMGPIKTQSRIDVPKSGQQLKTGRNVIGGVAWAQHTGIRRVQVQIDNDPWVDATLAADPSIDTWVQWAYDWDAPLGIHRITIRATDRDGHTTGREQTSPIPNGADGWQTLVVEVNA